MAKKLAWLQYGLLAAILVIGLLVRLYKIDNPIGDWHSWRQADTASVSRYFYQHGINLLYPKYDDRSSLPSGKANPEGYRMVEFPVYNSLHAILAKFNFWSFDESGRRLSVFISLLAIICLFGIVNILSGPATALLAALFMALLPFSIYYSRVVLPDPLMTLLWLLGTWLFLKALADTEPGKSKFMWWSLASFALGFIVRPYLVFFFLPLAWFAFCRFGVKGLKSWRFWLYAGVFVTPFILWRLWIRQFPEGIPASGFLFNYSNLRFGQAWFRWLFGERLAWLILGGWGLIPLGLGLLSKSTKKENWFYQLWFLGILLYFSVFAGGNVMHDYYQAIIIPVLAVLLAKGVIFAFTPSRSFIWPITPIVVSFACLMMLGLTWYMVREYYNVNNWSMVRAGISANKLLPADALVVAPYQINRPGWPIVEGSDIKNMIDHRGITHYISLNYDDITNKILQSSEYEVLEKTPEYVIVQLRYPNNQ